MKNQRCPNCNYDKHWKVMRQRLTCARCRHEWIPYKLLLRLPLIQWRKVLRYFMVGLSSNRVATETVLDKRRVLRVLNITREIMLRDIPGVFEGTVKVDEIYIGGQWRNKRKAHRA